MNRLVFLSLTLFTLPILVSHTIQKCWAYTNLYPLIPLFPSLLLSVHIRYLVLHILPSYVSRYVTDVVSFKILPPLISPLVMYQRISSCFILQPMLLPERWSTNYDTNPDTKVLLEHLSHNAPLNKLIIVKLVVAFRKEIAQIYYVYSMVKLFILKPILFLPTIFFSLLIPLLFTISLLISTHFTCR